MAKDLATCTVVRNAAGLVVALDASSLDSLGGVTGSGLLWLQLTLGVDAKGLSQLV